MDDLRYYLGELAGATADCLGCLLVLASGAVALFLLIQFVRWAWAF